MTEPSECYADAQAVEAPAPAKQREPLDDITVMSRIKLLMTKLPKEHQQRVAKWTADRWA